MESICSSLGSKDYEKFSVYTTYTHMYNDTCTTMDANGPSYTGNIATFNYDFSARNMTWTHH